MGEPGIGRADAFQRRTPAVGLPVAVVYKYVDDQATYLAVIVTYYALFAIFPLLLLGSSVLGFVLQGDPELQARILDSALSQFPVIGEQFRRPGGMTGSTSAVVVGLLVATYGAMGLGTAVQNALNVAWAVPRNSRPNPVLLRLRSLMLVTIGGVAILGLTGVSIVLSNTAVVEQLADSALVWVVRLVTVLLVTAVLVVLLRLASARDHRTRTAVPGALLIAVLWHVLQNLGAVYVTRVLKEATALNQTFGLVLGLMAVLFVASVIGMLGVELNVVLERRLWPRALLTPFTDSVVLTEADQRAYTSYARAQRHKGFETVSIAFEQEEDEPT